MAEWKVNKIQYTSLAYSQLAGLECKAWTLPAVGNITAESLDFWLI